jgi:hypothetical protein
MQLTDEVHWRYVYDRDGTLKSYSMGTKKDGKWAVEKDELCLYLKEPDDGSYEISLSDVAKATGAIPYDIKGVEFGHHGDRCSFDAVVSGYDIKDPALDHLALIVRGADTARPDLAPQCLGLLAISHGLSSRFADDDEQLKHGMIMYDAFYQWCRLQQEIIARATLPFHSNGVVH